MLEEEAPNQMQQLRKEIRDHLVSRQYLDPAPIQKQVLPYLLQQETPERFVYIKSPTGTGKTLSFLLPPLVFFEEEYLQNFQTNSQESL